MRAATRILFLDDEGEKFFGEGPAKLLRRVEDHGSLRAAALSMDMAYSKALKLIRQAETALDYPLITRTTGGKNGGGSRLTPEGRSWLARYETYRDACIQENQRLYRTFFPKTGCVIMASGMGVRFGANKLMADFLGAPLFLRAIAATEGLFDRRVVVTRHEEVARICSELGIQAILHDLPGRNDTVRLGLDALGDVDCCLFCPGDQPLLRKETVAGLLTEWHSHQDRICRPVCGGSQGSPVLFPRWTFPELQELPQGKGGGAVIARHPEAVHTLQISDPLELLDADTPEALALLERHLANNEVE